MFEVGKKVIAIRDHSEKDFKKGDIFDLIGIKKSPCGCGNILLNINYKNSYYLFLHCLKCGNRFSITDEYLWFESSSFAPYDDSLSEHTVDSLLEEIETQSVCLL